MSGRQCPDAVAVPADRSCRSAGLVGRFGRDGPSGRRPQPREETEQDGRGGRRVPRGTRCGMVREWCREPHAGRTLRFSEGRWSVDAPGPFRVGTADGPLAWPDMPRARALSRDHGPFSEEIGMVRELSTLVGQIFFILACCFCVSSDRPPEQVRAGVDAAYCLAENCLFCDSGGWWPEGDFRKAAGVQRMCLSVTDTFSVLSELM